MKFLKWLRKPMKWIIYLAVAGCCLVIGINLYMQGTVKKRIVTPEQAGGVGKGGWIGGRGGGGGGRGC